MNINSSSNSNGSGSNGMSRANLASSNGTSESDKASINALSQSPFISRVVKLEPLNNIAQEYFIDTKHDYEESIIKNHNKNNGGGKKKRDIPLDSNGLPLLISSDPPKRRSVLSKSSPPFDKPMKFKSGEITSNSGSGYSSNNNSGLVSRNVEQVKKSPLSNTTVIPRPPSTMTTTPTSLQPQQQPYQTKSNTVSGELSLGRSPLSNVISADDMEKKRKDKDKDKKSQHDQQQLIAARKYSKKGSLNMHNIFLSQPPRKSDKARNVLIIIRRVLSDMNQIMDRNDKSLRNLLSKTISMTRKLINMGSFATIMEDLKLIGEIILKSGYFLEIIKLFARLLSDLKNTEETFSFIMECKKMFRIVVKISKAIETNSQTLEMFTMEEAQRRVIIKCMKNLLTYIIHNKELILIIKNIENLKKQVEIAKEEQRKMFPFESFHEIMKEAPISTEILSAVQSIIGEMINVKLLARSFKEVLNFIRSNQVYKENIKEVKELVSLIYSLETLELNKEIETRTIAIIDRIEQMILEVFSIPSMIELRIHFSLISASLKRDPLNSKFIEDVRVMFKSLFKKESKYRLDLKVLDELKQLFIPYLINKIRVIPLPVITNMNGNDAKDKKIQFKLENVNIKLLFLDPKCVKFGIITCLETAPLIFKGSISSIFSFEITNIKLKLENFNWYFKKRSIPIRIKDEGVATLSTGERGVDLKVRIAMSLDTFKNKHFFQVIKSKCKINDINIQILKSKHNRLYEKLFSMFEGKIKKALEKAITGKLDDMLNDVEEKLYDTFFHEDEEDQDKTTTTTTTTTKTSSQLNLPDNARYGLPSPGDFISTPKKLKSKEKRQMIMGRIGTEVPRSSELKRFKGVERSKEDSELTSTSSQPNLIGMESVKSENVSNQQHDLKPLTKSVPNITMSTENANNNNNNSNGSSIDECQNLEPLNIDTNDNPITPIKVVRNELLNEKKNSKVTTLSTDSSTTSTPSTYSTTSTRNGVYESGEYSYNKDYEELDRLFSFRDVGSSRVITHDPPSSLYDEMNMISTTMTKNFKKAKHDTMMGHDNIGTRLYTGRLTKQDCDDAKKQSFVSPDSDYR